MDLIPRRHTLFPLTGVTLLLLSGGLLTGCAAGTSQHNQATQIQGILDQYGKRAYRCAPVQLAMSESHLDFGRIELKQGDFLRADEHLKLSRVNADSLKQIVDRRASEGDPCEELLKPVAEKDTDRDGIIDRLDRCPTEPEDVDGYQDEDGCPEPDNDADGLCDPWIAEQGLQAKHGSLCRGTDKCPNEPEDVNGFQDEDGCPDGGDPDRDQDGIVDRLDTCPDDPEDRDNFEDADGCPDADNDRDNLCDPWVSEKNLGEKYAATCKNTDKCPDEPEDLDTYQDEDGCPDPDNDADSICDPWVAEKGLSEKYASVCKGLDKCPNEPENMDGVEDDDGCPEKYKLIVVTDKKIELKQMVFFATDKATILPRSYPLLNDVAQALLDRPTIKVRIEGHTDSRGSAKHNLKLSQARADSVRKYLIRQGVGADRMTSIGYGMTKPIDTNETAQGRAANRRVEFFIEAQ